MVMVEVILCVFEVKVKDEAIFTLSQPRRSLVEVEGVFTAIRDFICK